MTELLFDREAALRQAAVNYADERSNPARKALRIAAIKFAEAAREVDALFCEETPS